MPRQKQIDGIAINKRSEERRKRMVANRAADFEAAEDWYLDFRQSRMPRERLSAPVAIRNDVLKVSKGRKSVETESGK